MLAVIRSLVLCGLIQGGVGLASTISPETQLPALSDPGIRVVQVSETPAAAPAEVGVSGPALITDGSASSSVAPQTTDLANYRGADTGQVTTYAADSKRPATRSVTSDRYGPLPSSVAGAGSDHGPIARYAPEVIALVLLVATVVYVERRSPRNAPPDESEQT